MSSRLSRRLYAYGPEEEWAAAAHEEAVRTPYLAALVRRHFPVDRGATIVDLGCGSGLLLATAARLGYNRLAGVEGAARRVAMARARGVADVVEGDLLAYAAALAPDSCDLIVAFDVLEHFGSDALLVLVDAVRAALRPGGRWLIHVPNAASPFFGAVFHGDLTHRTAFTPDSLTTLLCASGFRAVSCYEDEPVIHGALSLIRWLGWRVLRTLLRTWTAVETGDLGCGAVLTRSLLAEAVK